MRTELILLLATSLVCRAAAGAEDLRFVVIGDTRPTFESENFRVFEELIGRINQRRTPFRGGAGPRLAGGCPRHHPGR